TGLLSLMAAQLGAGEVTAVEITEAAYRESVENFQNSPWAERLTAIHQDIQSYSRQSDRLFDLIICNPPFFQAHSRSQKQLRNIARHTDQLAYREVLEIAKKHALPISRVYLLLPAHAVAEITAIAQDIGLHLINRIDYRGYSHNTAKVAALTFGQTERYFASQLHTIYQQQNIYSAASEAFLSPFLLRFAHA
ncbi:MAG: methyltransferase, partial [Chromatiales bacterium]|nr:methyltransferase [Chromatiales bacterium]